MEMAGKKFPIQFTGSAKRYCAKEGGFGGMKLGEGVNGNKLQGHFFIILFI